MRDIRDFRKILWEYYQESSPALGEKLAEYITTIRWQDAALHLVEAFYSGSTDAVNLILDMHSPITIRFQVDRGRRLLNEEPLELNHRPFLYARNSSEVKNLMERSEEIGLGFLTGSNSEHAIILANMTNYGPDKDVISEKDTYDFEGDLPRIDRNGLLHNPELLNALLSEKEVSHYPEAYSDILCWVPKDLVDSLDMNMEVFEPVHHMHVDIRAKEGSEKDKSHKKLRLPHSFERVEEIIGRDASQWDTLNLTVVSTIAKRGGYESVSSSKLPMVLSYTPFKPSKIDALTLLAMTTPRQQHGLDFLDGHYLCSLEVNQAMVLNQTRPNEINALKAEAFVRSYSPLLKSALGYKDERGDGFDINPESEIGFKATGAEVINLIQEDGILKDWLLDNAPPAVLKDTYIHWLSTYHYISYATPDKRPLVIKSTFKNKIVHEDIHGGYIYAALSEHIGMTNKGIGLPFTLRDIEYLTEKGIKLDEETSLFDGHLNDIPYGKEHSPIMIVTPRINDKNAFDIMKEEVIDRLLDLGVYPAPLEKVKDTWQSDKRPKDLEDTIKQAARFKGFSETKEIKRLSLNKMVERAGPEACAKVAKTPAQWNMLREVFGADIAQFAQTAPAKIKRQFLSDDLGI